MDWIYRWGVRLFKEVGFRLRVLKRFVVVVLVAAAMYVFVWFYECVLAVTLKGVCPSWEDP